MLNENYIVLVIKYDIFLEKCIKFILVLNVKKIFIYYKYDLYLLVMNNKNFVY